MTSEPRVTVALRTDQRAARCALTSEPQKRCARRAATESRAQRLTERRAEPPAPRRAPRVTQSERRKRRRISRAARSDRPPLASIQLNRRDPSLVCHQRGVAMEAQHSRVCIPLLGFTDSIYHSHWSARGRDGGSARQSLLTTFGVYRLYIPLALVCEGSRWRLGTAESEPGYSRV
jgi:hypothetical protein